MKLVLTSSVQMILIPSQDLASWGESSCANAADNTLLKQGGVVPLRSLLSNIDQGLSLLNPYQDYLLSRWNSGNYNFTPLLNEVEEMQSILVASLNKLKA